jgi:putative membrane protein insertion efficiency factor
MSRVVSVANAVANAALIALIRVYQYAVSPMLGQRCKYYPSCSNYAIGALREHGVIRGVGLASWRILRCNPFSNGGYDPVPPRHDCAHHQHSGA